MAQPNLAASPGASVTAFTSTPATVSGQSLVFPADLVSYPFFMTLAFYAYQMPSFYINQPAIGTLSPIGTIRLPLPNYMVDNQMVVYDQESLGLALGAGLMKKAEGTAAAIGGTVLGGLAQGAVGAGNALGNALGLGTSSGTTATGLQLTAFAVNPFLTVMFKTPAFKKHSLSWKLSPKNAAESVVLNTIINTLKLHQLPDISSNGILLTYPDVVLISVSNSNPRQYFSYLFKRAVVEACSINYTPSGQPAFFTGTNAPGEVEIALNILEIEMWLKPDYNRGISAVAPIGGGSGPHPPPNTFNSPPVDTTNQGVVQ